MTLYDYCYDGFVIKSGYTALMVASSSGHLAVVALLLKHNAEVNIKSLVRRVIHVSTYHSCW